MMTEYDLELDKNQIFERCRKSSDELESLCTKRKELNDAIRDNEIAIEQKRLECNDLQHIVRIMVYEGCNSIEATIRKDDPTAKSSYYYSY